MVISVIQEIMINKSDKQKVEINENSQGDTEEKRTIRKKGTSNVETD